MRLLRANFNIIKRCFSHHYTPNIIPQNDTVKQNTDNIINSNYDKLNTKIEGIDNFIFAQFFLWNGVQFPLILYLI
jgi:hypothetical protein